MNLSPSASIGFALMAFSCTSPPEQDSPPDQPTIAFVSDRTGDNEIFVMNPDATGLVNLTRNEASDTFPSWSPDGDRLVFVSDRSGRDEVYSMNADGGDVQQLSACPGDKSSPGWSPDGERIVFALGEMLHLISASGGESTSLAPGVAPSWSGDGTWVFYNSGQIPVMMAVSVDGGDPRPLGIDRLEELADEAGRGFYFCMVPTLSPDGSTVLFTRAMQSTEGGKSGLNYVLFTMGRNGQGRKRLTCRNGWALGLAWSPGGERILFSSTDGGNSDIYTMNADGTNRVNLTNHESEDWWAAWSRGSDTVANR